MIIANLKSGTQGACMLHVAMQTNRCINQGASILEIIRKVFPPNFKILKRDTPQKTNDCNNRRFPTIDAVAGDAETNREEYVGGLMAGNAVNLATS